MSCLYLTKIVSSIPDIVEPKTQYLVENGDGTFTMYVSDSQGNLNKLRDAKGVNSIQAGDNVIIDNSDPNNPIINVVLPETKELEFVANGLTINKQDNVVTITNTPTIEGVNAGDNIEIDRTIPTQPVIKSIIPEVLKGITEDKIRSWDAKLDNDTLYDDTELREKITALEGRVDSDTIYNDTELRNRIETLENKQDNDTVYDDTEIRGILNTKVSLNDLQDDLVIKSQEILDNNLKVVLTYTNTKGQSKDLEINQPLPQYELPEHLANLTSEQIEKLLKLIENIGIWDDEQPRIFNDNFTNEFA